MASNGEGPLCCPTPICQRRAVLKNFNCSGKLPRKMCGGGSKRGSETPNAQSSSHRQAKSPIETRAQPVLGKARRSLSGSNDQMEGRGGWSPPLRLKASTRLSGCAIDIYAALYFSLEK